MPWRIELLGGLRARQGERVVARFANQKGAALLAYLAYHRKRAHSREELAELLWPEAEPEAGRHNLRQALLSLRRQLEPADGLEVGALLFVASRAEVQLSPVVVTDVEEFEAGLKAAAQAPEPVAEAAELARVVDLYGGPLLPGMYDDWLLSERERLGEACLGALDRLAQFHQETGDLERALDYGRRAVALDPLREAAHLGVMRLLVQMARPADALRQYGELERTLREQLDVAPSAEAATLARELSAAAPAPAVRSVPKARPAPLALARPTPTLRFDPSPPSEPRLPAPATRFFGREEELERVGLLLRDPTTRLITLTGPGGSGKTRLAIEAARRATELFAAGAPGTYEVGGRSGGPWFVPLADRVDARMIPDAVAEALQLTGPGRASALDQVVAFLDRHPEAPALLILDNFEHLIEQGAVIVADLIERVPSLTCLVTSRQRLEIEGEHEFAVLPLPVPALGPSASWVPGRSELGSDAPNAQRPGTHEAGGPNAENLLQFPSVQLFLDRARASRPDFQVTARNAEAVARLCERLEGIPLALELAAARAQMLTPSQMLLQLEARFDFLVSRRRDIAPRHRTLRAAFGWSYELLPQELRRFFARLSVFHGRWTLEAAEAVCGEFGVRNSEFGAPPDPHPLRTRHPEFRAPEVLDYLTELRERSLILVADDEVETSFRMLETLREYAAEQLGAEERAALQRRHAEYYLAQAERAEWQLHGPEQSAFLDRLDADHDNFRAVLAWSLADPEAEAGSEKGVPAPLKIGLRLAGLLHFFWYVRGPLSEGRRWLGELLAAEAAGPGGQPYGFRAERAAALHGAAGLATVQGDFRPACVLYEECLAIRRALGDRAGTADTLCQWGYAAERMGDRAVARTLFMESLEICRELNDRGRLAHVLKCLGANALARGEDEQAELLFKEGLDLYRTLRDQRGIAMMLGEMAHLMLSRADSERASLLAQEHLELARQLKDRGHLALALRNLGHVVRYQGDHAAAQALFAESLALRRELGGKGEATELLAYLCSAACLQGDPDTARGCMAECLGLMGEVDDPRVIAGCLDLLAGVAIAREAPGQLTEVTARRAARLLAAAEALRGMGDSTLWWRAEHAARERHVAAARAALGEPAFRDAWAEGQAMHRDAALAEARRINL